MIGMMERMMERFSGKNDGKRGLVVRMMEREV